MCICVWTTLRIADRDSKVTCQQLGSLHQVAVFFNSSVCGACHCLAQNDAWPGTRHLCVGVGGGGDGGGGGQGGEGGGGSCTDQLGFCKGLSPSYQCQLHLSCAIIDNH